MDIVQGILNKHQKDLQKYKPINVEKHLDCRIDAGLLLLTDPNDISEINHSKDKDSYIFSLTRDNTQLLINSIWDLPTERVEECIVAKLPVPTITIPRLRKVPGLKVLTKWEKFALEKGITKKKKDKKVYDTTLDKWVPTYGFKHAEAERNKDWVIEVPQNADPNEDMFKKKMDLRNEKIAKNEIQRMKNIVRAKKIDVPRTGYLGSEAASSKQLLTAVSIAKASTASVGKFQEKISKEKKIHGKGIRELIPGATRKKSHIKDHTEKDLNLHLVNSIINKKPKYDIEKAISLQKQEAKTGIMDSSDTVLKRKKKGNTLKRSKLARKPKSNHGQKAPAKKLSHGKKRR